MEEKEIKLSISKKKRWIKRPVVFMDEPAKVMETVAEDYDLQDDFIIMDPMHANIQVKLLFQLSKIEIRKYSIYVK